MAKGIRIVPDFFNGSRVIPEKDISPELEAQIRAKHAELVKIAHDFRDTLPHGVSDAEFAVWDEAYDKLCMDVAEYQVWSEETYGLDIEKKFWLDEKKPLKAPQHAPKPS